MNDKKVPLRRLLYFGFTKGTKQIQNFLLKFLPVKTHTYKTYDPQYQKEAKNRRSKRCLCDLLLPGNKIRTSSFIPSMQKTFLSIYQPFIMKHHMIPAS